VAFEACREGWFVHDKLLEWGTTSNARHDPSAADGVGQHGRKNDPIDAEAIGMLSMPDGSPRRTCCRRRDGNFAIS